MTAGKMSQWITNERRLAIYLRDSFACQYCAADLHHVAPEIITLDHIVPRSKGGTNSTTNLMTACKTCNSTRGNRCYKAFAKRFDAKGVRRINGQRRRRINLALAKSIIEGRITIC